MGGTRGRAKAQVVGNATETEKSRVLWEKVRERVARPVYTKTTIIRAQLFVRYSQASVEGGGSGRIGTFSKRLIGRRLYVFQPTGHLAHGTRATPGDRLASSAPLPDRGQHVEISVGSEPPPLSPRNGLVSSRCAPCGVAVSITQNMMQVWGGWVGG